ncbi:hypothetical protein CEXT_431491 [Caerostris extrusa]|uniref:Uncharacterized protein n=1 Tax=Caerostris extrusa TaxID=172846 RepID=A0AAV4XGJ0_CAEEX|nr:hypothetical protein CEXT_431491 [Caerostris extrusa]
MLENSHYKLSQGNLSVGAYTAYKFDKQSESRQLQGTGLAQCKLFLSCSPTVRDTTDQRVSKKIAVKNYHLPLNRQALSRTTPFGFESNYRFPPVRLFLSSKLPGIFEGTAASDKIFFEYFIAYGRRRVSVKVSGLDKALWLLLCGRTTSFGFKSNYRSAPSPVRLFLSSICPEFLKEQPPLIKYCSNNSMLTEDGRRNSIIFASKIHESCPSFVDRAEKKMMLYSKIPKSKLCSRFSLAKRFVPDKGQKFNQVCYEVHNEKFSPQDQIGKYFISLNV